MLIEAYILSCWNDFMALYRSEGRKKGQLTNWIYPMFEIGKKNTAQLTDDIRFVFF